MEAEVASVRRQLDAMTAELKVGKQAIAELTAQCKRSDSEVGRRYAPISRLQSPKPTSYLELLRSRDWRRGFDLNLLRDLDARAGVPPPAAAKHWSQSAIDCKASWRNLEFQVGAHVTTIEKSRAVRPGCRRPRALNR